MIGIDCVDLARFRHTLERSPGLARRFFTADELEHCRKSKDFALHLASTFAAKEAVMKATGLAPAVAHAMSIEITRLPSGAPQGRVHDRHVNVSISHDGPVVVAVALATS